MRSPRRLALLLTTLVALASMSGCQGCQDDDDDDDGQWPEPTGVEFEFDPLWLTTNTGILLPEPVALTSTGTDWASGARQTTDGLFHPSFASGVMGPATILQLDCPWGCSVTSIIQTWHAIRKSDRTIVNPSDALRNPGPSTPSDADAEGGFVVDRPSGAPGGPYRSGGDYQPATKGPPPQPGRLGRHIMPAEFKPGYRIVFDACALCVRKKTDVYYGQWFGCIRWYYDTDSGQSEIGPQYNPPFEEFDKALDKWSDNHGDSWRPTPP
jgi:hypothetical protein